MAARRNIEEGTPAGDLAVFLINLVRNATVRELAEKFGSSPSTWGNYLNGAYMPSRPLLGKLIEAYTPAGSARNLAVLRASELWTAADRDRRAGGGLVRQHQRRDDALQQVIKYQALTKNAQDHLAELRVMHAYMQSRLENAELQLKLVGQRERALVGRELGQARERLGRVLVQQERARSRRMTAEEQQEFWMTEALIAQEEINRLERESQDLTLPQGTVEPADRIEADGSDFETRLEHITAEGLEDDALIEADLQHGPPDSVEDDVQVFVPVQTASNIVLDQPTTGTDAQREEKDRRLLDLLETVQTPAAVAAAFKSLEERKGSLAWLPVALTATAFGEEPDTSQRWAAQILRNGRGMPMAWEHLAALVTALDATPEETEAFESAYERVRSAHLLPIYRHPPAPSATTPQEPPPAAPPKQDPARPALRLIFALIGLAAISMIYLSVQAAVERAPDLQGVDGALGATLCCLPVLYGVLRLGTVPKLPARITALTLHTAWATLLLLDAFPWVAPQFGNA
ncbi:hypothetical protein ACGFX2_38425 [Streptomyces goshikiensis]|uniref:helix-turn-helix domain-containing protein n=1 Tax=Streptomyces goshikiensis TaxID=1942 RepID=UPI003722FF28